MGVYKITFRVGTEGLDFLAVRLIDQRQDCPGPYDLFFERILLATAAPTTIIVANVDAIEPLRNRIVVASASPVKKILVAAEI